MRHTLRVLAALLFCLTIPLAQAKRAPNLELKDLAGATHKVAELRGSIVVINFWATWCGPCREELPMLATLNHKYAEKKVHFIAVSANEAKDRSKIDEFLNNNTLSMDIWVGADLDMLERAGLGNVLPATLILDDQGEVVARILGEAREEDIRGPLDWLLGGKVGAPPAPITKRY
jgi:thiol-disulfide isomerase/thioredoxin